MTSMTDSMTDSKTEKEYLQDFQEKQRNFYFEKDKKAKKEKRLTQLKNRQYFLPKDLLNLVLSYIPEYTLTWFSNGEFNLSINCLSLHSQFLENNRKVIGDNNSFIYHGVCECAVCNQYNTFDMTEYERFYFIANAMDVEIVSLCPREAYDDYRKFKSNNPDIKQRIIDYFHADWHRDSHLKLQISWMRRACETCENRIEFCYELLPEFFRWAQKKRHYITYECMEAFIKKLLKIPMRNPIATDSEHAFVLRILVDKCMNTSLHKKDHMVAKLYRYMVYAIDYLRRCPTFHQTSIRKAREFKNSTYNIRVHLAIDNYLNLLN